MNLYHALYHGGVPGKQIGDLITPGHSRDNRHPGCPICEARAKNEKTIDPASAHPDRVYVSSSKLYARYYASLYGRGDLYLVCPEGYVARSLEDSVESFVCEYARVLAVIDRGVLLRPSERLKVFIRLAKAEGVARKQAIMEFNTMLAKMRDGDGA
jgi:hypothetical protein